MWPILFPVSFWLSGCLFDCLLIFAFFFPEEEKRDKETKIIGRNHLTYVEN